MSILSDKSDFIAWYKTAAPYSRYIYYTGNLWYRDYATNNFDPLISTIRNYAESGRIYIMQRKIKLFASNEPEYEYIAIRSKDKLPNLVPYGWFTYIKVPLIERKPGRPRKLKLTPEEKLDGSYQED